MGITTLNIPLTDEEFDKLNKAKGEKTWHDFILLLINIKISKNGDRKEVSK